MDKFKPNKTESITSIKSYMQRNDKGLANNRLTVLM